MTEPRETSQRSGCTAAADSATSTSRYCHPSLAQPCCQLTLGDRPPGLSRCAARLSFPPVQASLSCTCSSDSCLKMWTPSRALLSFPSSVKLLLELVACQSPFLLQLACTGMNGPRFGLACSLVNFSRKLQLTVGYRTSSIKDCSCTGHKSSSTGSPRSTRSHTKLSDLISKVPPSLRSVRLKCQQLCSQGAAELPVVRVACPCAWGRAAV